MIRAVVQARMLSNRLRGKSLMAVHSIPLLYRVVHSIKKMEFIDEILVATTRSPADDPIAAAATHLGVDIYRGDSENVLKRFRDATSDLDEEDTMVRFTADNPVYDMRISAMAFLRHFETRSDYTHIEGLSHIVPEFIKIRALREMDSLAKSDFDREHVTPFLRKNSDQFKIETLPADFDILRPELDKYLTLDNAEDLRRFESLFGEIGEVSDIEQIYEWMDRSIGETHREEGSIKLSNSLVGEGQPTFIIAEIGQNHNGSVKLAKDLIDMAIRCGVDAVKFQKRDISSELTKAAFEKPYESPNSFGKTYGEHRKALELDEEEHKELREYARAQGMTYFCTPCDIPSVEMMERVGVPFYKVASRDLTNLPTLAAIAKTGKPVIISTGMAGVDDISDALDVLGRERLDIIILQCISQYPAELRKANLSAMNTLRNRFGKIVGYSDHTVGIIASVAASIMGAAVVEKHITLSRAMKGSDQAGSLEENGLKLMVKYIREAELAKGDGVIEVDASTATAKIKLARSLTSRREIREGEILTEEMLCLKSPGDGLLWRERDQVLGKRAAKTIPADVTILLSDLI